MAGMPVEPGEALGDLLRGHRRDAGFTQEDLAERAGISARAVSDMERGLRIAVHRDTVRRLADALELDEGERVIFEGAARRRRTTPQRAVPSARRHQLPAPLTALIGRDRELAAILAALDSGSVRVLTLVGPGGVGKTRLAIEAARTLSGQFADGGYFVELAVTRDPSLVPALVARALGVTAVRKSPAHALRDRLRGHELLLVLDTFEHVAPAAAFVAELAVACPGIRFLVTSRAALHVRGEHVLAVTPLPIPAHGAGAGDLPQHPATALFLERALSVKPGLNVGASEATTIINICRRLDGLPLAIELAAVRLRHMPLAVLEEQLEHRLDVLVGGPRDLPARQQTMRSAIAWSYQLLPADEKRLLRALSVFAGGWTVETAELAANETATDLLAALTALVDANLVTIDESTGVAARFTLLDVIREFAIEQAMLAGDSEASGRWHAEAFAGFAEAAEQAQGSEAQEDWYRRLEREHDNMRAALEWSIARGEAALAQRIAGALWLYWRRHGDYSEARHWLGRALSMSAAASSNDRLRRKLLWGEGWISYYQGDYAHVRAIGDELLGLAEQAEDRVAIRNALTIQALVAMAEGRFIDAVGLLETSVDICRLHCTRWLLATSLLLLGQAMLHGPDLAGAQTQLREALSIYTNLGDPLFMARSKGYLGYVAMLDGRPGAARRLFAASLRSFGRLGEQFGIAEELQAMATLHASTANDERAAELAGAAHRVWEALSAQALASDRPIASRYLDAARRRLGRADWRSAWQRGQRLELEDAIKLALTP